MSSLCVQYLPSRRYSFIASWRLRVRLPLSAVWCCEQAEGWEHNTLRCTFPRILLPSLSLFMGLHLLGREALHQHPTCFISFLLGIAVSVAVQNNGALKEWHP